MLHTELDSYIAEARRASNKSALKVLQLIKAEFQKYLTFFIYIIVWRLG